ncbi:MAG TPA: hypothetical protein DCM87_12120 [Planctomycetes bacterium]|nr:hypothetical protein [Planctomycetota bacterium]
MARLTNFACLAGIAAGLAAGCGTGTDARRAAPAVVRPGELAQPELLWLRADDMAQPIVTWLRSVKARDAAALQRALSSGVKARLGPIDWNDLLAHYDRTWREQLGEWRVEDFAFVGTVQKEGELDAAEVTIAFAPRDRAQKTLKVDVVREGPRWCVNEFPRTFARRGAR